MKTQSGATKFAVKLTSEHHIVTFVELYLIMKILGILAKRSSLN